jgi:hypothetical protein
LEFKAAILCLDSSDFGYSAAHAPEWQANSRAAGFESRTLAGVAHRNPFNAAAFHSYGRAQQEGGLLNQLIFGSASLLSFFAAQKPLLQK